MKDRYTKGGSPGVAVYPLLGKNATEKKPGRNLEKY
jgi:hypothetical protein